MADHNHRNAHDVAVVETSGGSTLTPIRPPLRDRKFADSSLEGGVSCELVSEVKFASRAPNGSIPRGLGTILGAVERLFRARTGNNRAKTQHFRHFWMLISRLLIARARARAAGFPRAGRKSQRRRRDKRADQPFAKIKELFKKIKRLS